MTTKLKSLTLSPIIFLKSFYIFLILFLYAFHLSSLNIFLFFLYIYPSIISYIFFFAPSTCRFHMSYSGKRCHMFHSDIYIISFNLPISGKFQILLSNSSSLPIFFLVHPVLSLFHIYISFLVYYIISSPIKFPFSQQLLNIANSRASCSFFF